MSTGGTAACRSDVTAAAVVKPGVCEGAEPDNHGNHGRHRPHRVITAPQRRGAGLSALTAGLIRSAITITTGTKRLQTDENNQNAHFSISERRRPTHVDPSDKSAALRRLGDLQVGGERQPRS